MSSSDTQSASCESPAGLSDTVRKQNTVASSSELYKLVSNLHVEDIEGQLDLHYLKTYGPQVQDLGNRLFQHA